MKKKQLLSGVLAVSLAGSLSLSGLAAEPVSKFADDNGADSWSWASEEIYTCVQAGILQGFPDNTFAPEASLTRAQAAVVFSRAMELTETDSESFSDDDGEGTWSWASDAIYACKAADIIEGRSDGSFDPDGEISRAEIAVMVARALSLTGTSDQFTDDNGADTWSWAADAIYACKANGIISGYEDGTFRPDNSITRAEMAVIAVKAFLSSADGEAITEVVTTDKGEIKGFAVEGSSGNELYCYYGVPYAEAPVNELRWKDAQEKSAWDGVLDCTAALTEQNSNYQWGTDLLSYFETLNESEDCLYLNVTTPAETTDEALPVIVWFHGGGLFGGSGSEEVYNLTNLPEHGCVLVTVTTRLGALGMLSADILGSETGSSDAGNFMISDMIASLKWVQNNIAAFGGDASNVTIAGESGGGQKVNALIASPEAAGLFSKAILQSGTASAVDMETAKADGNQLLAALGVSTLEEAQAVPAEDIVAAYNELGLSSSMVIDGYYLTDDPVQSISQGNYNPVDVIIGLNEGELSNLAALMNVVPSATAMMTRLTADGHSAYAYELNQVPATWREYGFHCVHSMDIAYLFGEYTDSVRYYSGGPWEQQFMFWGMGSTMDASAFISPAMDEDDKALSEAMMELWVSFAADGTPVSQLTEWAPWNAEDENYLYLTNMNGETPSMKTGFSELAKEFSVG